jgi:hypothetical protein
LNVLQLVGKVKCELAGLEGDEVTQISGLFNRQEDAPTTPRLYGIDSIVGCSVVV